MRSTARMLGLLLVGSLSACGTGGHPNIVLLVVDTLRADHLGAYGSSAGLTPFLDGLAARGVVFEQAYAQSSWTNPSVASLLTSRFQTQHGVIAFTSKLADSEVTLPEVLHDGGYRTLGWSANAVLPSTQGFGQGYDSYGSSGIPPEPDRPPYLWRTARAAEVNAQVLQWIDAAPQSRPTFLYVQYVEPHTPYFPTPEALARVLGSRPVPDRDLVNTAVYLFSNGPVAPEARRDVADYYDASVRDLDAALRTFFSELERRHFLDDAVIVVTADHGEELQDHARFGHGKTLYEEVVHVPLIVVGAGITPGRDPDPVALIDLAPTLVEIAGGRRPARFEGMSLAERLGIRRWSLTPAAEEPSHPPILTQLQPAALGGPERHRRAVIDHSHKLIARQDGSTLAFDLATDPREANPRGLDDASQRSMQEALAGAEQRAAREKIVAEVVPIDETTRNHLRALGYAR